MNIRVEVKIDGVLKELHELEVEPTDRTAVYKYWDFVRAVRLAFEGKSFADFVKMANDKT